MNLMHVEREICKCNNYGTKVEYLPPWRPFLRRRFFLYRYFLSILIFSFDDGGSGAEAAEDGF
jgi:hypothetical protein